MEDPSIAAGGTREPVVQIFFGSQTGNTRGVAEQLATAARTAGLSVELGELNDFDTDQLASTAYALILTSTYNEGGNEGDMPDNAELFWKSIATDDDLLLSHLRYAVLALGDDGYFDFCHAGILIDERLSVLGAQRLAERVDCDIYYEEPAAAWTVDVVQRLVEEVGAHPVSAPDVAQVTPWNRMNRYPATMVDSRTLTGPGSLREVRHYELDLGGSGITYTAGDSIAVQPVNDPELVAALIKRLVPVPDDDTERAALEHRLLHELEIGTPPTPLLERLATRHPQSGLAAALADPDRAALKEWCYGRDLLDVLDEFPDEGLSVDDVLDLLRPLQARQFSIASSPLVHPDRVHLTVATVRYGEPREHRGVATTYLAERVAPGGTVEVFPQPNATFSLPKDPATPIIMIGPGTGIAPFRGFLQERALTTGSGDCWLFFGARSRATDYLYADELQGFLDAGTLTRLDLAFSRDQDEKEYVQTRIREKAAEVYAWLERGAHVYVCGDAARMAVDVDDALMQAIAVGRQCEDGEARSYLDDLVRAHRYLRDIY
jgi:sulfite reductase (NADPH) flavoprotein alpha-component